MAEAEIDAICQARALARARAWKCGCGSRACDPRFRATPITSRSEKRHAVGHYKGGFHPLLVSWGREVLAGILLPGNTGAGNAEDHLSVLELALEQFPASALDGENSRAL